MPISDTDAERFWRIVSRAYYGVQNDVAYQFQMLDRMAIAMELSRSQILLKLRSAYDHKANTDEEMAWALSLL